MSLGNAMLCVPFFPFVWRECRWNGPPRSALQRVGAQGGVGGAVIFFQ